MKKQIGIDVPGPLSNDLYIIIFQKVDAERVNRASQSRISLCVKTE